MKYNKGIAPVIIVLTIIAITGTVFAVVQRNVLKGYFEKGDKPTQAQFADTIDSSMNFQEDADRTDSKMQPTPMQPSTDTPATGQKEYNPTKVYVAGDTVIKSEPVYQRKVLSDVGAVFVLDKVESVTFRWTPLVPKPREPSTFRLKIWQLMEGQSGAQAMETNKPIATKDITDMTEVTVGDLYTGPCKPPYLCSFVWSVEALASVSTKTETVSHTGTDSPVPTERGSTGAAE